MQHKDASKKNQEVVTVLDEMRSFPKVQEFMEALHLSIEKEPIKVKGQIMTPGKILMGDNKSFPADCNPNDFDRNIQQKQFD